MVLSKRTKWWSELILSSRDLKLAAPSEHLASSKKGVMRESINPLANLRGYVLSQMMVKTTCEWIL